MIQQTRKTTPKKSAGAAETTRSGREATGGSAKKAGLGAMSFADAENALSPSGGASAKLDKSTRPAKSAKKGELRLGDEGAEVTALQLKLKRMSKEAEVDAEFKAEFNPGKIDGKFSARTENAVRAVQSNNNLPMTGVYDAATASALTQELSFLDQMKASME